MMKYKDGCSRCRLHVHSGMTMMYLEIAYPWRNKANSPSRKEVNRMNETHDLNKQPNVSERAVPRYPANRPDVQAPQADRYAKGPGGDPIHEPLLEYFKNAHLPPHLRSVSQDFETLAEAIARFLPRNPERTVCLRKLLEAKDCAVRAAVTGPVT